MAKTKISQFDAVASNNTDINSVNVAEGCPPSGINNAIREMASLLKKQEVGTDAMTSPDIDGGTIDGATIGGSSGVTIGVSDGTVSAPSIKFTSDTNTGIYRGGTDILKFVTAGTDAITIGSNQSTTLAGNLNVSKVNAFTTLDGTTGYSLLKIKGDSTLRLDFGTSADDDAGRIQYDAPTNNFRFYTNNTRVVDIDNSGNLLVGTTDTTPYNNTTEDNGVAISGSGWIATSRNNNASGLFNLTGDDGAIIDLRKDGSTVGSIGNNTDFYIASQDGCGLRFTNGEVLPCSESGAIQNGSRDLGSSSGRFQDLYLSGGAYIGGTGSANKLDDYEEGSFTPSLTSNSGGSRAIDAQNARYVKIGKICIAYGYAVFGALSGSNTGTAKLGGFPFNYNGSVSSSSSSSIRFNNVDLPTSVIQITLLQNSSGTSNDFFFSSTFDNTTAGELGLSSFGSGSSVYFSITYEVA